MIKTESETASATDSAQQLALLRRLLQSADHEQVVKVSQAFADKQRYSEHVAAVISEALAARAAQDDSLSDVLSPTVEQALTRSIENDPKRLANALYPVMGPAIRKSINEVLAQTLETFNQLLEQSLSPRSLLWRFDAWRTGHSYPEVVLLKTLLYQVEQVFLIHRESGLLLQHVVSPQAITRDPDMISGMLTAIRDFIHDSFAVGSDDALNDLRLGDLNVLVEQGPYSVLAVVVRGNPPADLHVQISDIQEQVHRQMGTALQHYQGDSAPFARIRPLLERCLSSQVQKPAKRTPWLVYLLLAGLLAGGVYWAYLQYQQTLVWQTALATLKAEPGLVVIDTEKTASGQRIQLLRDPLARDPAAVLPPLQAGEPVYEFSVRLYLSMEPALVQARVQRALQAPAGVEWRLQDGVLVVSGEADSIWRQKLELGWSLLPGVEQLDASTLRVHDAAQAELAAELAAKAAAESARIAASTERIQSLRTQIEQSHFEFAKGDSALTGADTHAGQVAELIMQLVSTARAAGRMVQITMMGAVDETGTSAVNARLARERAELMHAELVRRGVPAAVLFVSNQAAARLNERSVRYQVSIY